MNKIEKKGLFFFSQLKQVTKMYKGSNFQSKVTFLELLFEFFSLDLRFQTHEHNYFCFLLTHLFDVLLLGFVFLTEEILF